jgi:glutamine synthetase
MRLDHPPLLTGDVFTKDPITTYIYYKLDKEVNAMRQRPHPYEFACITTFSHIPAGCAV